ncbi:hypothetical protein VVX99_15645 [Escherichia coli]|uniref:hypothetical protein n=1 Tax=Escherichia coli TaxID=562 RepID=UPI002DEC86E9|nr:hypothetical protein [Escherichia coli]
MPDMSNYQYLINPHFNCEHDIAKKVYSAADGATDNISMGIASIGSLMWHASENEDYDEKAMRIDMRIPLYSITDWHRSPISDSHPFDQPGT